MLEANQLAGDFQVTGLVAMWIDPQFVPRLKHQLRTEPAKEHKNERRWSYRKVHCADVNAIGEAVGHVTTELGVPEDIGQTHPQLFKTSVASLQESRGVKIILARSRVSITLEIVGAFPSSVRDIPEMHTPRDTF